MKKAFLTFAGLLLLAGGGAVLALAIKMQQTEARKSTPRPIYRTPVVSSNPLDRYELVERSGAIFDSRSLEGKVHLVNFFFATCPGRCPMQTAAVAQVQSMLRQKGLSKEQVMLISITVDPENDTPAALREYAGKYKADRDQWMFLTGNEDYLARVAGEIYQVPYKKLTHVERLVLVDKWGQIRGDFRWYDPTDFANLQAEILKLVAETEKPTLQPPPREEVPGEKEAREEMEQERKLLEKDKPEQGAKDAATKR
jgi:protein SCO1/2